MSGWQIIEGDCLPLMRNGWVEPVDAIITSPPYADQRANQYGNSYRWQDAYGWFAPYARAMLDTGARALMLNVGRLVRDGQERPLAEDLRRAAQDAGWRWIDTLLWHKTNALPGSAGQYLTSAHEYVWWLAAPGIEPYRGYDADTRTPHASSWMHRVGSYRTSDDKASRYYKRGKKIAPPHPDGARPTTVFDASVGQDRGVKHTAPMSLKLATHLVCLSCPPGGTVLDPFAGSGTTILAALRKDRSGIGIEVSPESAEEARERIRGDAPLLNAAGEAPPATTTTREA